MKTFVEEIKKFPVLESITCDCCKKTLTQEDEWDFTIGKQEFLSIDTVAGYGAIMGDQNRIELDMCQECQVKILGDFIRVTEWCKPTVTANEWMTEYQARVDRSREELTMTETERASMTEAEAALVRALQADREQ